MITLLREEVIRKLCNMLKTNPFARIRRAVAEALWTLTGQEMLLAIDWGRPTAELKTPLQELGTVLPT